MSQALPGSNGLVSITSDEKTNASAEESHDKPSKPRDLRPRVGSAPWIFSAMCNADEGSRKILERAACALLYDDGTKRAFTRMSLRLLDEALATGCPDALILKGIVVEELEKDAHEYFHDAERKGSSHPFISYRLGDHYMKRDQYDEAFNYLEKGLMSTYLSAMNSS